jgi:hypothetical protein
MRAGSRVLVDNSFNGGGAGIRTPDTANMSRMLYHLSYTATKGVNRTTISLKLKIKIFNDPKQDYNRNFGLNKRD